MKPSIITKLNTLKLRYEELAELLSQPDIINSQDKFRKLSIEFSDLEEIVQLYAKYEKACCDIEEAKELLAEDDLELKKLAQADIEQLQTEIHSYEEKLNILLLPKDPNDNFNVFLEIRAGTGGDEAAIFAGDLLRMYLKHAETKAWRIELVSENFGEHGGYKEVIARVIGDNVYSDLKFESGIHRVQRVPATESQGRIHTSACTVAVLPEVELTEEININPADLRIDTFRASGAGGQHVNKTDSAIRLTHLPTGIVVECQDERSQHKNRAKAMSLLSSKILAEERAKQIDEQARDRKLQVGSGDRSGRIRTYNFPQGRLTDHRINLTLYKLEEIMQGKLAEVIEPLKREYQAEMLASLQEN